MKHFLFIDSDTMLEYQSETAALKRLKSIQDGGGLAILVSVRSNFYEIRNSSLVSGVEQVYSFDEVLKHVGSFSF